jgi:methionyl-tRNA formyltransferase
MNNVVIFSPSRFSLNTICITALLIKKNIKIEAIIVRKLYNPSRFTSEFKRDGKRLLIKIWNKLILRKKAYVDTNQKTIISLLNENNIKIKTVDQFKKQNIPVIYCTTLNDKNVVNTLKKKAPKLVIFTGGGLIKKQVLKVSGDGILNCHMGILPKYRGMDVVEWPLLENEPKQLGITVHFMNEGLDTGDILKTKFIKLKKNDTIKKIRRRFEPIMCLHMVDTCLSYLNGSINKKPQNESDGKQYFIMHQKLIDITEKKINSLS